MRYSEFSSTGVGRASDSVPPPTRVDVIILRPAEGQEHVGDLALGNITVGHGRDIGPGLADIMGQKGATERQAGQGRAGRKHRTAPEQATARQDSGIRMR